MDMTGDSFTVQDTLRALEAATKHLEEAEEVLWTAATRAESTEHTRDIEAVTRGVWDTQHELLDLKRKFE
jgi:hypothetical protein